MMDDTDHDSTLNMNPPTRLRNRFYAPLAIPGMSANLPSFPVSPVLFGTYFGSEALKVISTMCLTVFIVFSTNPLCKSSKRAKKGR